MSRSYTAAERAALVDMLRSDADLRCPVCDAQVTTQSVAVSEQVSYVRRRTWLICTGCRRTAAVDVKH